MAYTLQLIRGSEPAIDLQYNLADGWTLLNRGIQIADPEISELWGGRLEDQLVRREEGKRLIPLKLFLQASDGQDLIDKVNALEERLRHAAQYHKDGWGEEVFLSLKLDDAIDPTYFPVISGTIDKGELYSRCSEPNDVIMDVPVFLTCEAYWEADATYALENMIDNPGFWRGILPGDSWTEVDPAGNLAFNWSYSIWQVMGRSLQWTLDPDAVNDIGINSDNITVTADTNYYLEARGYHTTGCDDIIVCVYDVTNGAWIAFPLLSFNNQDNAWEKLGASFTTPAGCVSIYVTVRRWSGNSTAGRKTFYCDAVYLTPGSTAPVGWSSGRNLLNHLDGDADHLNVLCVTEIPGEVEAECRVAYESDQVISHVHVAKRTRDDPYNYIWELLGVNAVVTAGDANCKDSVIVGGDATAPGGSHVAVSFAGFQTMQLRCYWDITAGLTSYYGRVMLGVLAKATGGVDTINMRVRGRDESNCQGYTVEQTIPPMTYGVNDWMLVTGWEALSYRVGTSDNDLLGPGNNWRIELYASHVSGDGINNTLKIAGVYLIPVDESWLIGGQWAAFGGGTGDPFVIKDMDGDRGVYGYDAATGTWHPNLGAVGRFPTLTPKVENWLYFIGAYADEIDITDTARVSLTYRPRGIFLRGTNP